MKTYDVKSVTVEAYVHGPRAGQQKPIRIPDDAQIIGVVSGFNLRVYYIVPAAKP